MNREDSGSWWLFERILGKFAVEQTVRGGRMSAKCNKSREKMMQTHHAHKCKEHFHSTKNKKSSLTKCNPLLLVCFYGNIRCYSLSFWISLFTFPLISEKKVEWEKDRKKKGAREWKSECKANRANSSTCHRLHFNAHRLLHNSYNTCHTWPIFSFSISLYLSLLLSISQSMVALMCGWQTILADS